MRADNGARIGPNAILQLVPVLDATLGVAARRSLIESAGIAELPDGSGLVDEDPVARLHQALRASCPDQAADLATSAGLATGDYIIANRIPGPARRTLRLLPPRIGSILLCSAIAKHAWTFAGSGAFRVVSSHPPVFEIADNPVVRGETADGPVCHWHVAVFERLFRRLVHDDYRVVETHCMAAGDGVCRFEVSRRG